MNMIFMLGIFTVIFFVSLFFLCVYRRKINTKIANICFIVADVLFYFCWNIAAYHAGWLDGGGWMTIENISPMIVTVIPMTLIMSERVRDYAYSAIALLAPGMFAAMLISPEHAYLFTFHTEANFIYTSEAACHLLCALFGCYLVLTKQVKVDFRHWVKAIVFLYSIISFGVFLNFVFHRGYFGMDPYGDYSIYMLDIFGSFPATLIAYYLGVAMVVTLGMQLLLLLSRYTLREEQHHL